MFSSALVLIVGYVTLSLSNSSSTLPFSSCTIYSITLVIYDKLVTCLNLFIQYIFKLTNEAEVYTICDKVKAFCCELYHHSSFFYLEEPCITNHNNNLILFIISDNWYMENKQYTVNILKTSKNVINHVFRGARVFPDMLSCCRNKQQVSFQTLVCFCFCFFSIYDADY